MVQPVQSCGQTTFQRRPVHQCAVVLSHRYGHHVANTMHISISLLVWRPLLSSDEGEKGRQHSITAAVRAACRAAMILTAIVTSLIVPRISDVIDDIAHESRPLLSGADALMLLQLH